MDADERLRHIHLELWRARMKDKHLFSIYGGVSPELIADRLDFSPEEMCDLLKICYVEDLSKEIKGAITEIRQQFRAEGKWDEVVYTTLPEELWK